MNRRLAWVAVALVLLSACSAPLIRPETAAPRSAAALPASEPDASRESENAPAAAVAEGVARGKSLTLAWGESAQLDDADVEITFESIFSDGRCPLDVECAESAPVTVNLKMTDLATGATTYFNLSAHTDDEGAVVADTAGAMPSDSVGAVDVTLQRVTPYPARGGPAGRDDYRVTLLVAATSSPDETRSPAADGEAFTLTRADGAVALAGSDLSLRLRRVDDTRCPLELDCIQGGSADVSLTAISESAGRSTLRLSAPTDLMGRVFSSSDAVGASTDFGGYTVTLLRVFPYPQGADDVAQDAYRVTLRVTPSQGAPERPTPAPSPIPVPSPTPAPSRPPSFSGALQPMAPPGSQTSEIHFGETVTFDGGALAVTFEAVNDDSRCPLDVNCAWSGVVNVQLTAKAGDGPAESFELGGVSDSHGAILGPLVEATGPTLWGYEGYTIELKAVRPYPAHANEPAPDEDYSVVVSVRRADGADVQE